jgi:hypothetical protein
LRVAVREVDRGDNEAVDLGLEVACLAVELVAGEAAADLDRLLAPGEDRDAVMGALAVPEGAVAGAREDARRTFLVGGLDLLEADDVGARLLQPFEQPRQAAVDAVDVIGRDLQSASAPAGAVLAAHGELGIVRVVDGLLDVRALAAVFALVGLLGAAALALAGVVLGLLKLFHGALLLVSRALVLPLAVGLGRLGRLDLALAPRPPPEEGDGEHHRDAEPEPDHRWGDAIFLPVCSARGLLVESK